MSPVVSVLMPVYNGERYLKDAVQSILSQTFSDFEFIIIDDGSTDNTATILNAFARSDKRIQFYRNEKNLGLSQTLNFGLELARGEYVARMDADDISLPERLHEQVKYMEHHAGVGVCGTWAELVGDRAGVVLEYPTTHDEIYAKMFFANSIMHPSVIMRLSILHQNNFRYDLSARYLEDYDLWSRILPFVRFANIPEVLLYYRLHGANTNDLYANMQHDGRAHIYARMLSRFQIEYTQKELSLHEKLGMQQYESDYAFVQNAHIWFRKLLHANKQMKLMTQYVLEAELANRWSQICGVTQEEPYLVFLAILSSPLQYKGSTGAMKMIRAFIYLLRKSLQFLANFLKKDSFS